MHTRTTAGQATIEYVAALALLVAILVLAGPAVGAPDVGRLVYGKLRLALCVVGGDVCSSAQAARDGLAPCPMRSDLTGHAVSVTAFSVEVGHRWTLLVTPQSDGTVTIVRTGSGTVGAATGVGAGFSAGPVEFGLGVSGGAQARVQAAFGWTFKNQAAADRFLRHATLNSAGEIAGYPPSWVSVEDAAELSDSAGLDAGVRGSKESGQVIGVAGGMSGAIGARKTRDGAYTLYGRATFEGGDVSLPLMPSTGPGQDDWLVEYTFGRDGARELAFRHGDMTDGGRRLTETVLRLDLRDPANRAAAQPLLGLDWPWPRSAKERVAAVLARIRTDGTVETSVSEVADDTAGVAGSIAGEIKFGGSAKRIKVHKTLVSATALTGGPYERERLDCVPAQG